MLHERECLAPKQSIEIVRLAGQIIVDTRDALAFRQQPFAQMGTDEARRPRNQIVQSISSPDSIKGA